RLDRAASAHGASSADAVRDRARREAPDDRADAVGREGKRCAGQADSLIAGVWHDVDGDHQADGAEQQPGDVQTPLPRIDEGLAEGDAGPDARLAATIARAGATLRPS